MIHKKWLVAQADKEKAAILSEQLNIDAFVAYLLVSRGIDNELDAIEFLSDSIRFSSPFDIKDMQKAVDTIALSLDNGERICIYGDYDCDGVTSTALLYNIFEMLGADVTYYIPSRLNEGYGMNKSAIDKIKENGVDLIVTVDNGISAIEEAEYIYSLGMKLVVTDHHTVGKVLPKAEAVVNPHRDDDTSSFKDFCGVGIAFKLACALCGEENTESILESYADIISIGTIGDIVPLKGENRTLVKQGIKLINSNNNIGIKCLKTFIDNEKVFSARDVAFQICPRINASGRIDHAKIAFELLVSEDDEIAMLKAQQLAEANNSRHTIEDNIQEDIDFQIKGNPSILDNKVLIIYGQNYHKGVVGINAARLVEQYGKPTIVIGFDENGNGTGSARSIEGFNIYDAINSCKDLLTHFGGHPMAAGLGINEKDIHAFIERVNDFADFNYPIMPIQTLHLDCKLSPFNLTTELVDDLSVLEPYGADNESPVFGLYSMKLEKIIPTSDGKHIRLTASKKGTSINLIKFSTTADEFPYFIGETLDFAVSLSKNFFKGRYYLSLKVIDVRNNCEDVDEFTKQLNDYYVLKKGEKLSLDVYPTRDKCAVIYKYLKTNFGWRFSVEDLYFKLQNDVNYIQLIYALKAFEECGLIVRENNIIKLVTPTHKIDLEKTQTLVKLKGKLQ